MKYTILGFNQKVAIAKGLDITDLTLLRWFVDFKDARKKGVPVMASKIINDDKMYWVQYEGILEEFPILSIKNKDSVYRRFKKLAKENVLKHETIRQGGVYSYYSLGEDYYELLSEDYENNVGEKESDINPNGTDGKPNGTDLYPEGSDLNPEGPDEKSEGPDEKSEQNTNLLYPSTIYTSNSKGEPFNFLINYFEKNICDLGKVTKEKFIKYLELNDLEFIKAVIDYCKDKKATSFAYFEKTINSYLEKNIDTKELLEKSIEEFKRIMEERKISALKDKRDPKVQDIEPEEYEKTLDKKVKEEDVKDLENLDYIKITIKKDISQVSFNTWIKDLIIKKQGQIIRILAVNEFTQGIIKQRYEESIKEALDYHELNYKKIKYELIES